MFMQPLTDSHSSNAMEVTVLIVDDSKSYRHLMVAMLAKWGFRTCEAEDGECALRQMALQPVHILISDWEMPVMDGVELCRAIRSHDFGHYIYTILVTARQSLDDLLTGMDAGADDFCPSRSTRVNYVPGYTRQNGYYYLRTPWPLATRKYPLLIGRSNPICRPPPSCSSAFFPLITCHWPGSRQIGCFCPRLMFPAIY